MLFEKQQCCVGHRTDILKMNAQQKYWFKKKIRTTIRLTAVTKKLLKLKFLSSFLVRSLALFTYNFVFWYRSKSKLFSADCKLSLSNKLLHEDTITYQKLMTNTIVTPLPTSAYHPPLHPTLIILITLPSVQFQTMTAQQTHRHYLPRPACKPQRESYYWFLRPLLRMRDDCRWEDYANYFLFLTLSHFRIPSCVDQFFVPLMW